MSHQVLKNNNQQKSNRFGNSRSMLPDYCTQLTNQFEQKKPKNFFLASVVCRGQDRYRPQQFQVYHKQNCHYHPLRSRPS